ncbi:MAG: hypothetical protein ACT4PT_10300, partial [Methanobacteriota archaeon]
MGFRFLSFAAVLLVLPIFVAPASAVDPWPAPSNPCASPATITPACTSPYDYHRYLFLPSLAKLPADYNASSDRWKYSSLKSGFPEVDNDPRELSGVTGMSVDRAWLASTGRPDVVIAVLDSGIRWRDADLAEKVALRRGELPPPPASNNTVDPYDANFDGALSPADYA